MRTLYPDIEPYASHSLNTQDGHRVYFEECGNPDGLPVIFLHGGPGSGCKPHHRCFFDPERYRIVLMDQRGTGRSKPAGGLAANDTHHLLADMEAIRTKLSVEQWVLFGGSWGATLALLYAESYPAHVLGMLLRGTFLARQQDVDWFLKDGANRLYPEAWEKFVRHLGSDVDVIAAYHQRLLAGGTAGRAAARAWDEWGGSVVLGEEFDPEQLAGEVPDSAYHQALIETHYALHRYFISENQILDRATALQNIPCVLIHGRLDFMCPVESAWVLKARLPEADIRILPNATHLAQGDTMINALVAASDEMADRLL